MTKPGEIATLSVPNHSALEELCASHPFRRPDGRRVLLHAVTCTASVCMELKGYQIAAVETFVRWRDELVGKMSGLRRR